MRDNQWLRVALALLFFSFSLASCDKIQNIGEKGKSLLPKKASAVQVKSVALKIILIAGSEALRIATENYVGVTFDSKALMNLIAPNDAVAVTPISNGPILIVVNKKNK